MKSALTFVLVAFVFGCGSGKSAATGGAQLSLQSPTGVLGTCDIVGTNKKLTILDSNGATLVDGVGGADVSCTVGSTGFSAQVCQGSSPCLTLDGAAPTDACSADAPCTITGVSVTLSALPASGTGGTETLTTDASTAPTKTCTVTLTSYSADILRGSLSCAALSDESAPQAYACQVLGSQTTFGFTNCK